MLAFVVEYALHEDDRPFLAELPVYNHPARLTQLVAPRFPSKGSALRYLRGAQTRLLVVTESIVDLMTALMR